MSKRFNYRQYREDLIKKYVKKYGSKDKAILGLYSDYRAQKLLKDTVSKMVDWSKQKDYFEELYDMGEEIKREFEQSMKSKNE
tara:strand:+ start:1138 stop:1386 length:249 start_codon:yes stop_codon:yes gene_type:complete